jgi:hypothetical protein
MNILIMHCLYTPVTSSVLDSDILLFILFTRHPQSMFFPFGETLSLTYIQTGKIIVFPVSYL